MFNWLSAPTFAAMGLFWILAAYLVTRSPRRATFALTALAQVAAAAFLLGQAMQANATTLDEWRPWARDFDWGATLAPLLWYWATLLLLRDEFSTSRAYRRGIGYPCGAILTAAAAFLTAASYVGDGLQVWSTPFPVAPGADAYFPFHVAPGPLYPLLVAFVAGATLGAVVQLGLGWRWSKGERSRRFAWLLAGGVLFCFGATSLAVDTWIGPSWWPVWVSHLVVGLALALLAINVAAYSLLVKGQVIRADLLFFLASNVAIGVLYAGVVLVVGGFSFRVLQVVAVTVLVVVLSHSLVDVARRGFDRVFFGPDVRTLRASLATIGQDAAVAPGLGPVLQEARDSIDRASEQHFVKLTETALRRLNNPASLATCELLAQLPRTLATSARGLGADSSAMTPLGQARALRDVLAAAIDRLKPSDVAARRDAPGALQYNILREEYLLGLPNVHVMTRHSIGEGTFNRHRRQAIGALARELRRQEELLAR